jgi:KDO2-lipid IV(A) lauroyltransferase
MTRLSRSRAAAPPKAEDIMRLNALKKNDRCDEAPHGNGLITPPAPALMRSLRPGGLIRWGGMLGELAYRLDRPHRRIVHRNLQFAYPSWTAPQVAGVARRMFQHFGMSIMEVLQLQKLSRSEILGRCTLTGADHLPLALSRGRGVVLVSGHLGNWEFSLQYLACRFNTPILLVVNRFWPPRVNDWVDRLRTRFGNRVVDKKKAFPAMRQTIREGGIVALMVDLSRLKQSVEIAFFGRRARASHAAALLATRGGATVLPVFSHRNAEQRIAIELEPPLIFRRSRNLKKDLQHNTQLLTDRVEAAVRRHPDQYLWVQKRWKDYHPYLYPGYRSRTEYLEE